MKKLFSMINLNLIGVVLIVGAFLLSAGVVLTRSTEGPVGLGGGKRIVRIMHWQLEPGYREAMQSVIDEYNALPHVREAKVEVQQLGVPERVYGQLLNVHAISGTAPDLCEMGKSKMVGSASIAQFFEALGPYAAAPNPYNAQQYLPPELAEGGSGSARASIASLPWRETFIDGMQGGWNAELQDFYGAPTSYFGGIKIYYNRSLMARAKQLLREAVASKPAPGWFERMLLREEGGQVAGYVRDTAALREWIAGDAEPDTLGRMLLACGALWEHARRTGVDELVPIAGSSYSDRLFADRYLVPFTSQYAEQLNLNHDYGLTGAETWFGWRAEWWSFEDPNVRAYFECVRTICEQFPAGFLGLDREQARRRFVSGNAGMIATGLWDAQSIISGAEGAVVTSDNPARPGEVVTEVDGVKRKNFRFQVAVMDFPMPGRDERWGDQATYPPSDATGNAGAAYMIYQRSPNRRWALDFLQYLTSLRVNERFNNAADWLPIVVGSSPAPRLSAFVPDPEGLAPSGRLNFSAGDGGNVRAVFEGQIKNYLAGDLSYGAFTAQIRDAAMDKRSGVDRLYFDAWQGTRDRVRNVEALIAVQAANHLLLDQPDAELKIRRAVRRSAMMHNGIMLRVYWDQVFPDEPFPEY